MGRPSKVGNGDRGRKGRDGACGEWEKMREGESTWVCGKEKKGGRVRKIKRVRKKVGMKNMGRVVR